MDESTETPRRFSKRKHAIFIMLPFLLLLLILGFLNIWARSVLQSNPSPTQTIPTTATSDTLSASVPTETGALKPVEPSTEPTKPPDSDTPLPTLAATAVPPAEVTLIPQPTLPPTATIALLGPPNQSRFMTEDNITIYWTWPLPLAEDQYFGIYLQEETGDSRIGRLEEANFGTGYRWQTEAQYLTDEGGEVSYLIKLETILTDDPLISSELRTLFIMERNE